MNQWTSWHQDVTGQRPLRADHYDSAEFLGPNAQIGRGEWSGIRNPPNPHAQDRLPPHTRDFDTMRKIAARKGLLLNHLDGYSGYGGQGQSLFAHHLSRQLDGQPNAEDQARITLNNFTAVQDRQRAGVAMRDFAYRS
jgi:hypothetical protein